MRDNATQSDPRRTAFINIVQLALRDVHPDEIPELRAMWWRQASLGHRLPAEAGVILIRGGE